MLAMPISAFNRAFCTTVKELRRRRGFTQLRAAIALGTTVENYRKYESRTPLPHRFIPAFCLLAGSSETELFTMVSRLAAGPSRRKGA